MVYGIATAESRANIRYMSAVQSNEEIMLL